MDKKNRGSRTSLDDSIDEFGLWKKIVLDLQRLSELRDSSDDLGLALDGIPEGRESGSLVAVVSGSQDKWFNIKVDSTFVLLFPPIASIFARQSWTIGCSLPGSHRECQGGKVVCHLSTAYSQDDGSMHCYVVFNHVAFFLFEHAHVVQDHFTDIGQPFKSALYARGRR